MHGRAYVCLPVCAFVYACVRACVYVCVYMYVRVGVRLNSMRFERRCMYKYPRWARGQDGLRVKSRIDLVLVKRNLQRYVGDVRGSARERTRHFS